MNRNLPKAERRFAGEYAPDGKAKRRAVRESAGHRCIRCGHPFESGTHGKGEWSPCDERCMHGGPVMMRDTPQGAKLHAQWRILTVKAADGREDNDPRANTLALCQRCRLEIK